MDRPLDLAALSACEQYITNGVTTFTPVCSVEKEAIFLQHVTL